MTIDLAHATDSTATSDRSATATQRPIAFISWAPYCSRSDSIAHRLGGESHMVYAPRWGSRYSTIALKYLSQAIQTLRILFRTRPRIVFVMAPPCIACIPVWLYCLLFGARFVIDAHTGAFLDDRWRRLLWLQRFLSRRAVTTIVTNEYLQRVVTSWNAHATIVTDVPVRFARATPTTLSGSCNMAFVSSFGNDEPTAAFIEAAARLPHIQFHVTGDLSQLSSDVGRDPPTNVRFTGFLSDGDFVGLLKACDAVLALTTRDHTMQRAAYEAIYLGIPVITSDFGLLRDAFPKGTVHVEPTGDGIVEGVVKMADSLDAMRVEALQLRDSKLRNWNIVCEELLEQVGFAHPNANGIDTVAS